jgi:hypothetical protein
MSSPAHRPLTAAGAGRGYPQPRHPPPDLADELRLADSLALVRLANQITLLLEQSPPPLRTPRPARA